MKRTLRLAAVLLLAAAAVACARRTVIPDDELAQIFHDAFLSNAYIAEEGIRADSLNVYAPIFARYGYTTEDVQYTVGNFSRRKSARLGDVVEEAIDLLEAEGKFYEREVAVLDTIDNVARRTFTRRIAGDTLVRVGSLRDTARMQFDIAVEPGEYQLALKYFVDSLDRNEGRLRGKMWIEHNNGSRSHTYNFTYRRNREERISRTFRTDTSHSRLHVDLFEFTDKPKRPSVTFRDFSITHTLPVEEAVDSLYARQLDIRIFADEFIRAASEGSR